VIPAVLLSPLWLLALGTLLIPILLHLVGRGRFRRVKIGSVSLLRGDESRRGRHVSPSQLPLLLIRCLLLAALAIALAGPRSWNTPAAESSPQDAWILADHEILQGRDGMEPDHSDVFEQLDSLVDGGAELHVLAPGIPLWDPRGIEVPSYGDADLWSLLREADWLAEPGTAIHVLAVDRMTGIKGVRPRLDRPVQWTPVSPVGENRWIERVGPSGEEDLDVIIGRSGPHSTTFSRQTVSARAGARPSSVEIELAGGTVQLLQGGSVPGDDQLKADLDRTPLVVLIFNSPDRQEDASYVRAALASVEEFTDVALIVTGQTVHSGEPVSPPPGGSHLIFWLSSETVPSRITGSVEAGAVLISDGPAAYENCSTRASFPRLTPAAEILLRRCSPGDDDFAFATLWSDGFGRPFLAAGVAGEGKWFRIHSRVHPFWSDLPMHPALPAWLSSVIEEIAGNDRLPSAANDESDLRVASTAPYSGVSAAATLTPRARSSDASPEYALWIVLVVLLGVERFMAVRRRPA
jgi:hypothetical protein